MNVIESSAWLSYLAGDSNSDRFSKAIEDLDRALVPSITLTYATARKFDATLWTQDDDFKSLKKVRYYSKA